MVLIGLIAVVGGLFLFPFIFVILGVLQWSRHRATGLLLILSGLYFGAVTLLEGPTELGASLGLSRTLSNGLMAAGLGLAVLDLILRHAVLKKVGALSDVKRREKALVYVTIAILAALALSWGSLANWAGQMSQI